MRDITLPVIGVLGLVVAAISFVVYGNYLSFKLDKSLSSDNLRSAEIIGFMCNNKNFKDDQKAIALISSLKHADTIGLKGEEFQYLEETIRIVNGEGTIDFDFFTRPSLGGKIIATPKLGAWQLGYYEASELFRYVYTYCHSKESWHNFVKQMSTKKLSFNKSSHSQP